MNGSFKRHLIFSCIVHNREYVKVLAVKIHYERLPGVILILFITFFLPFYLDPGYSPHPGFWKSGTIVPIMKIIKNCFEPCLLSISVENKNIDARIFPVHGWTRFSIQNMTPFAFQ